MDPDQKPLKPNETASPEIIQTKPQSTTVKEETAFTQSANNKNIWKLVTLIVLVLGLGVGGLVAYKATHKTEKPAQTVVKKEIAQVTIGSDGDGAPNDFYPHGSNFLNTPFDVNKQIFEGLVQFQDVKQIKPLLATGWTNPDDDTWIFTLQPNVKFHSGRTMTAKDVKYSLENFKDTDSGKTYNNTIKSVDVIDGMHVKITTNGPDPILLNKLTSLYIMDASAPVDDPIGGTGPYMIKDGTTPTDSEIQLAAFDDWHGGRALTRALVYKDYPDEDTLMAAYKKGDIDVASNLFDDKSLQAIGTGQRDIKFIDIAQSVIQINTKLPSSPLTNTKVRQALYASLDQAELLKARGLEGVVQNQIVPKEVPGYNPDIPAHKRDVALAKKLLQEAGYPNGVTISDSYATQNGTSLPDEIIKEAKESGITVRPIAYDNIDKFNAAISDNKLELWQYSWNTSLLDASDVFTQVFQSPIYSNPTINAEIASANKTLDATKRLAILQQISKDLMNDAAWIPMYSHYEHWAVPANFVINRDWPGEAFGVSWAKVYAQ